MKKINLALISPGLNWAVMTAYAKHLMLIFISLEKPTKVNYGC
jgi:hypothetical protein